MFTLITYSWEHYSGLHILTKTATPTSEDHENKSLLLFSLSERSRGKGFYPDVLFYSPVTRPL
jgi:hypothetical protein